MAEIVTQEMLTPFVEEYLENLPTKNVLFKAGVMEMSPPGIRQAISGKGGKVVEMPEWILDRTAAENIKSTGGDYTATKLSASKNKAPIVFRRKYFTYEEINNMVNAWRAQAPTEIMRQFTERYIDYVETSMQYTLQGAIPSSNELDITSETYKYISEDVIFRAENLLGDNQSNVPILICHSAVSSGLKRLNAKNNKACPLYAPDLVNGEKVYFAANKIVWETDRCKTSGTGATKKYHSYLLGKNVLSFTPFTPSGNPMDLVIGVADPAHETRGIRVNVDFVPYLQNTHWNVSTVEPTDAQLGTSSNWTLGAVGDAKALLAVRIISEAYSA